MLPRFEYVAPETIDEVLAHLLAGGPQAKLLAGGTDLVVAMKKKTSRPSILISLSRIPQLSGVRQAADGEVCIGPMTTMVQLARSRHLRQGGYRALAEGAASVGGPAIRNRATLGGNLCTGRPCADTAPPLFALGARVVLTSPQGSRTLPVEQFITAPGQTVIAEDELMTEIRIPPGLQHSGSAFLKLIRRQTLEVAIVSCAAYVQLTEAEGPLQEVRIALGSVAPTPVRANTAEQALVGKAPDDRVLGQAARLVAGDVSPITDHRATRDYRCTVVEVLARRAIEGALRRARGEN